MPARLRASVRAGRMVRAAVGRNLGTTPQRHQPTIAACSASAARSPTALGSSTSANRKPPPASATWQSRHISGPLLKAHLANHVGRGAESLLFPDEDGTHLRADRYRYCWELARKAIKKPHLRVHDLRHVGAVLAAQSGATTAELMHRLGHTTPEMALRYQHVAEGRDAEIAERLSKLAGGKSK